MDASDIVSQLKKDFSLRPSLPVSQPTKSRWQEPPHPTVATAQSPKLPEEVDVAIIGSGITGCSVAYALLGAAESPGLRICVLEARGAVSGATGRNGGHLVSDADSRFETLLQLFGREEAIKIFRFSEANIARLRELAAGLDPADRDAVEFRDLVTTAGTSSQEILDHTKDSIGLLDETVSKKTVISKINSKEEAESTYHYCDSIVGGVEQHGAAALSPYRLITAMYSRLLQKHDGRFSLETHTPVSSVTRQPDMPYPYQLETPRGTLHAKKVIHCTNGYSAYLTPSLAGKLFPFRGTMSCQAPGPSFPRMGSDASWNLLEKARYDPETRVLTAGLYYAQQNPKTGDIWVGGEVQRVDELISSDDSVVSPRARENILSVLPRIWRGMEPTGASSSQVWSGVMGFTADGLPLVGKLTSKMTGRAGDGEWIAAGFNGHGMDKCWLTGEAITRMVLHGTAPESFPAPYLLSEERFDRLTAEAAVESLFRDVEIKSDSRKLGHADRT